MVRDPTNIFLTCYPKQSNFFLGLSMLLFIPHHTKSGGVLCYTRQTLSVCPSIVRPSVLCFRALTLVPFDLFSSNFA